MLVIIIKSTTFVTSTVYFVVSIKLKLTFEYFCIVCCLVAFKERASKDVGVVPSFLVRAVVMLEWLKVGSAIPTVAYSGE